MEQIQVELQEWMGSDSAIANAAWTSTYNKEKREEKYDDHEKVASLVPRLIREGHSTPVESVVFRFWIRMPVFTDRQHVTHRIASHNGLSGRYRTMPNDWYVLPDDVLHILEKAERPFEKSYARIPQQYDVLCTEAYRLYNQWLERLKEAEQGERINNVEYKRAREVLRGALPTSGMVERTTVMNLRSFANYQRLRNSEHAQAEIRQVAALMLEEVKKHNICPIALQTLEEVGWDI